MRIMKRKHQFSLIELLVVMAISGILLTIGIPAFTKLAIGNELDYATSSFRGALERTQSSAITSRRKTAMLLDLDGKLSATNRASYRLCYVDSSGTNQEEWIDDAWKPIGTGVVIGNIGPRGDVERDKVQSMISSFRGKISKKIPVSSKDAPALIFSPYGTLQEGKNLAFLLSDGTIDSDSGTITYKESENYKIIDINRLTGAITTVR